MWRWMIKPRFVIARVVIGLVIMAPLQIAAQTPGQDYGPPTEIARESLPALPLLYTAYGFAWVALIGYVFLLWRRLAKVERELADVNSRIAQRR